MNPIVINTSQTTKKPEVQLTETGRALYEFTMRNPEAMAISTKLIDNPTWSRSRGRFDENDAPVSLLQQISERTANAVDDIKNIYEIIPETATVETITVSSILSPNDFVKEELIWSTEGDFPSQIATPLLERVRETFETVYKINRHLRSALADALFKKGSYVFAIFPESAIDDVINNRTTTGFENYKQLYGDISKSKGLLGQYTTEHFTKTPLKRSTASFESVFSKGVQLEETKVISTNVIHTNLEVNDNPDIFKLSALTKRFKESEIRSRVGISLEDVVSYNWQAPATVESIDEQTIADALYKQANSQQQTTVQINDQEQTSRKTFGRPLLTTIPHMAVIPVHVPGDPEEHIGYFILLDQNGQPVSRDNESNFFNQARDESNRLNGKDSINQILREIKTNTQGQCCDDKTTLQELDRVYQSFIERDLIARLNNGIHGENVKIANTPEVYRIMLSRALAGLRSQLLFLPTTLVQYIAFEFDKYGIGESLVKKARMQAAMTASGIYASQIAMLKNAIQSRRAVITLDPNDPDPWKRREQMIERLAESNNFSAHFSQTDPRLIESSLSRIGYEIVTEGHPDLPEMRLEVETKSQDRAIIEDTVLENNRDLYIRALKCMPSVIDATGEIDFAAQVVNQNAILARQQRMYSLSFSQMMTDLVRKVILQDGKLLSEMTAVISGLRTYIPQDLMDASKQSALPIIERFLDVLRVGLPLPEVKTENDPATVLENYVKKLDAVIPAYFSSDDLALLIPEPAEGEDEDENARNEIKKQVVERMEDWIKNQLIRDFIAKNNLFPELRDVLFLDSDKPNVELMKLYLGQQTELTNSVGGIVSDIYMNLRGSQPTEDPDTEGSDSGDDESSSDDSGSSDDDFGDDFGSDDIGEEEPTDDETETEEAPEVEEDDGMPDI